MCLFASLCCSFQHPCRCDLRDVITIIKGSMPFYFLSNISSDSLSYLQPLLWINPFQFPGGQLCCSRPAVVNFDELCAALSENLLEPGRCKGGFLFPCIVCSLHLKCASPEGLSTALEIGRIFFAYVSYVLESST